MAGFLAGFSTEPKSPPISRQNGGILGEIVAEFGISLPSAVGPLLSLLLLFLLLMMMWWRWKQWW
jgi:hypothetical protein